MSSTFEPTNSRSSVGRKLCGELVFSPIQAATIDSIFTLVGLCPAIVMVKMNSKSSVRMLQAILQSCRQQSRAQLPSIQRRCFRSSINHQTDGVYKALTEMRVRTPWIEALRQNTGTECQDSEGPSQLVKPDLTPKTMSDSYFKCVGRRSP